MEMKMVGAGLVPARNSNGAGSSNVIANLPSMAGGHKARPYVVLVFLALSSFVFADTPQDLYKSGNSLYAEGKFSEAAQKYQAAAEGGLKSWVLEYNLGNAQYRAGQLGKAVLHYERAFRMNPGQGDVLYNLNLSTNKAGDPAMPGSALLALGWRLFYSLGINTLTLLTSMLFMALAFFAARALMRSAASSPAPGRGGFLVGISAAAFLVAGIWLSARIYVVEQPEGVVVTPVAEVRSGPNTSYPANFTIPEGRRVILLKEQEPIQGWLEVGVPQEGLKGWVPDSSVEVI